MILKEKKFTINSESEFYYNSTKKILSAEGGGGPAGGGGGGGPSGGGSPSAGGPSGGGVSSSGPSVGGGPAGGGGSAGGPGAVGLGVGGPSSGSGAASNPQVSIASELSSAGLGSKGVSDTTSVPPFSSPKISLSESPLGGKEVSVGLGDGINTSEISREFNNSNSPKFNPNNEIKNFNIDENQPPAAERDWTEINRRNIPGIGEVVTSKGSFRGAEKVPEIKIDPLEIQTKNNSNKISTPESPFQGEEVILKTEPQYKAPWSAEKQIEISRSVNKYQTNTNDIEDDFERRRVQNEQRNNIFKDVYKIATGQELQGLDSEFGDVNLQGNFDINHSAFASVVEPAKEAYRAEMRFKNKEFTEEEVEKNVRINLSDKILEAYGNSVNWDSLEKLQESRANYYTALENLSQDKVNKSDLENTIRNISSYTSVVSDINPEIENERLSRQAAAINEAYANSLSTSAYDWSLRKNQTDNMIDNELYSLNKQQAVIENSEIIFDENGKAKIKILDKTYAIDNTTIGFDRLASGEKDFGNGYSRQENVGNRDFQQARKEQPNYIDEDKAREGSKREIDLRKKISELDSNIQSNENFSEKEAKAVEKIAENVAKLGGFSEIDSEELRAIKNAMKIMGVSKADSSDNIFVKNITEELERKVQKRDEIANQSYDWPTR